MRAVVQRVSRARVPADGSVTGEIAMGLLILLGVGREDTVCCNSKLGRENFKPTLGRLVCACALSGKG